MEAGTLPLSPRGWGEEKAPRPELSPELQQHRICGGGRVTVEHNLTVMLSFSF